MRAWVIFLIIVLAIAAAFFIGVTRLPDVLANNLSKKLGVAVSIDSMRTGLSEIEIENMEIGNPRGYSLPKAFSAREIEVEASATHYIRNKVVIEEVEVKDIYLGLEFDSPTSTDGNWSIIFSNFQNSAKLDKEEGKSVLIKKIIFSNVNTEVLFRSSGGASKKLPTISRIELHDISTKGGTPTDQLMSSILGQMLKEVFTQENLNNMLEGILQSPGKALDSFLEPFKGAFNAAPVETSGDMKAA